MPILDFAQINALRETFSTPCFACGLFDLLPPILPPMVNIRLFFVFSSRNVNIYIEWSQFYQNQNPACSHIAALSAALLLSTFSDILQKKTDCAFTVFKTPTVEIEMTL